MGIATYRILNIDFYSQIIYKSAQPCSRGESSREANRKGRARCDVSGAVCDRTGEDNAQHPWSHDPKSSHCCLVQGRTTTKCWAGSKNVTLERREARRRVAPAPGSRLESESPCAVMHALRMHAASGRLSTLRPPLAGRGKEEGRKEG